MDLHIPMQHGLVMWVTFYLYFSLLLEGDGKHCREGSSIVHIWREKCIFSIFAINLSFKIRNFKVKFFCFTQVIYDSIKLEDKAVRANYCKDDPPSYQLILILERDRSPPLTQPNKTSTSVIFKAHLAHYEYSLCKRSAAN